MTSFLNFSSAVSVPRLSGLMRAMAAVAPLLGVLPASATDWKDADLPSYTETVDFVAIGSDGFLYSLTSNANGYVFTSLLEKYGAEPGPNPFIARIVSGHDVYYLGKACDAANGPDAGTWTKDGSGLNFAVEIKARPPMTFRALDTDITPSHSC
ncbi:hypothetical protein [Roseibium sp.]|uniref:hypothetical protein n=1 Tax=Roseibium sp. TaxID=1936156 RepID=UPI003A9793F4